MDDLEWIEKFYSGLEASFRGIGQTYVRPKDYVERALRIMNNIVKRKRLMNQVEGRKGVFREEL